MRKLVHTITVIALACTVVVSYAASPKVREGVDPTSGLKTLFLMDVHTHNCPSVSSVPADLKLVFIAQQTDDHRVLYSLSPALTSSMRFNIRRGDTMDTLTDGNPGQLIAVLKELAGHEHAHHAIYVHETVPFPMTREQLETLSKAQVFQFTLNGKNNSVERCVYAKDLKDLAEFLDAAKTY